MTEVLNVKLRKIGTSVGVIIPMEKLNEANMNIGDEIKIAILPKRRYFSAFGTARNAKIKFTRDNRTREFK